MAGAQNATGLLLHQSTPQPRTRLTRPKANILRVAVTSPAPRAQLALGVRAPALDRAVCNERAHVGVPHDDGRGGDACRGARGVEGTRHQLEN
jgi:hypothetical protein